MMRKRRQACRYGVSPYVLGPIVKDAVEKFDQVYNLQEAGNAYETAEELWEALGLAPLMNVTLHDYLQDASRFLGFPLINHNFITEAAAASTRVNYNQNPSVITALAGAPSDESSPPPPAHHPHAVLHATLAHMRCGGR